MTTHNYTVRTWGHDYTFAGKGETIQISGWGNGIQAGDYILLQKTRYQITAIEYCTDPPDMWFAKAVFSARTETEWYRDQEQMAQGNLRWA